MKRVPFEDRGSGMWIIFFSCLKAIACIGVVSSIVFILKGSAVQFGNTQLIIALILLSALLVRLPTYTKQALIEENKEIFEDKYFKNSPALQEKVWNHFRSYQKNQVWFFVIFLLSTLIAGFSALLSISSGSITRTALIVPVLHILLVIARIWSISEYELDPLPPSADLFDW